MVLQRAEVVHLRAVGVVQRHLLGGAALAGEPGVGAHAGVVAPEGDGGQQRGAVALAGGLLMAQLPHLGSQQVDAQVRKPRGLRSLDEQSGHHQRVGILCALESLDDGELAVGAGVDDEAGVERRALPAIDPALDVMSDDDRCCQHLAGRHADGNGAVVGGVQLVEDVVHGHAADQFGDQRGVGDWHLLGTGDSGAHCCRNEGREVEFGDAAVAPHFRLGRREGHRRCPLGGCEAQRPIGCIRVDGIGDRGEHDRNSTTRVVLIP